MVMVVNDSSLMMVINNGNNNGNNTGNGIWTMATAVMMNSE